MTGSMLSQLQALKLIMTERGCTLDEALILLERFKAERPDGWTPELDAKRWDELRATGRTVVDYPEQSSSKHGNGSNAAPAPATRSPGKGAGTV